MFLLGILLLVLGIVLAIPVLLWIGVILLVIGLVLIVSAHAGHGRYWY